MTDLPTSRIDLTWTDNAHNENGYRIERKAGGGSYAPVITLGRNAKSYSDTGLAANTTYRYRVRARDAAGNLGPYSAIVAQTTKRRAV